MEKQINDLQESLCWTLVELKRFRGVFKSFGTGKYSCSFCTGTPNYSRKAFVHVTDCSLSLALLRARESLRG